MADHNRPQLPAIEPRHRILRLSGYAAATAFCAVSMAANLQYGLSLGKTPIDKTTYAVASVATDIFKMAAPLLALSLWSKRCHILSIAALVLWLGCVGWSMTSAVGFVLSSRGEAIAERAAEAATRHGWEAKVERAETQLATLGKYRPTNVIRTELAAAAVPQHIWRRSRQCYDLTLEESRLAGSWDMPSVPPSQPAPGLQVHSRTTRQLSSSAATLDRWVQSRLDVDLAGSIPAREAYADFCNWARTASLSP